MVSTPHYQSLHFDLIVQENHDHNYQHYFVWIFIIINHNQSLFCFFVLWRCLLNCSCFDDVFGSCWTISLGVCDRLVMIFQLNPCGSENGSTIEVKNRQSRSDTKTTAHTSTSRGGSIRRVIWLYAYTAPHTKAALVALKCGVWVCVCECIMNKIVV